MVEVCPACGFSAHICVKKFPFEAPHLTRYVDPEGKLTPAEKRRIDRNINALEKRFPGIKIFTCLVRLPGGVDSREFAFWLFNKSLPASGSEVRERSNGILLLIDRNKRSASLTVGYSLDPFLDDSWLGKILSTVKADLRESNYASAMCSLFAEMRTALVPIAVKAAQAAERSGYRRRKSQSKSQSTLPQPSSPQSGLPSPHDSPHLATSVASGSTSTPSSQARRAVPAQSVREPVKTGPPSAALAFNSPLPKTQIGGEPACASPYPAHFEASPSPSIIEFPPAPPRAQSQPAQTRLGSSAG